MKRKTLVEEQDALRDAWLELWFRVFTTSGLVRLVRRLGLEPRPWITEREGRTER